MAALLATLIPWCSYLNITSKVHAISWAEETSTWNLLCFVSILSAFWRILNKDTQTFGCPIHRRTYNPRMCKHCTWSWMKIAFFLSAYPQGSASSPRWVVTCVAWASGGVRGLLRLCVLCCVSLSTAGSAVGPRGSAGHTVRRHCLFAASNSPLLIGRATETTSRRSLTRTDDWSHRGEDRTVSEGLVHWWGH